LPLCHLPTFKLPDANSETVNDIAIPTQQTDVKLLTYCDATPRSKMKVTMSRNL